MRKPVFGIVIWAFLGLGSLVLRPGPAAAQQEHRLVGQAFLEGQTDHREIRIEADLEPLSVPAPAVVLLSFGLLAAAFLRGRRRLAGLALAFGAVPLARAASWTGFSGADGSYEILLSGSAGQTVRLHYSHLGYEDADATAVIGSTTDVPVEPVALRALATPTGTPASVGTATRTQIPMTSTRTLTRTPNGISTSTRTPTSTRTETPLPATPPSPTLAATVSPTSPLTSTRTATALPLTSTRTATPLPLTSTRTATAFPPTTTRTPTATATISSSATATSTRTPTQTRTATQTATITSTRTPTPCGGDTDGDRIPGCAETNTGIYVSPTDTGTNPAVADTDGDFLPDGDEVYGTTAGLDLPALGASPVHKNLLLEYDWFTDALGCAAHSHQPTAAAIARATAAFAAAPVTNPDGTTGITLISDYGQGAPFTGGNLIADADGVLTGGVNSTEFVTLKQANFAANRNRYFHYVLLPHRYNTTSGSSGQAELPGDDLIVSLQCSVGSASAVGNTILHELGHNLFLRHGGNVDCNYKPNYNSVMNYRYQFPGVDTDCTVAGNGRLDYSVGTRISLNENSLDEAAGICGTVAVDWNANSTIESGVVFDVNSSDASQASACGGTLTTLHDSNDWARIVFTGLNDSDRGAREIIDCDNPVPADH